MLDCLNDIRLNKNMHIQANMQFKGSCIQEVAILSTFTAMWIFPFKGMIFPYWASLCNSVTHHVIELEN